MQNLGIALESCAGNFCPLPHRTHKIETRRAPAGIGEKLPASAPQTSNAHLPNPNCFRPKPAPVAVCLNFSKQEEAFKKKL